MIESPCCGRARRFAATLMTVFTVLAGVPAALAASSVAGRVLGPAGVTPVPDARVVFFNVVTTVTTRSEPTDVTGEYALPDLESGRYDVVVETARGLWMVERAVELSSSELRQMSFALRESTYWEGDASPPPRTSPVSGDVVGTAVILEQEKGSPDRWPKEKKRKVILGTAVGGGVLALALAAGGSSSTGSSASPFTPTP